jgi:hypothetical protein
MRNRAILLAALAIGFATPGRADLISIPSAFTLLGAPEGSSNGIPIPDPLLRVSLNPQPLPPSPDPFSGLSLTDPTMPVYYYPAPASPIENEQFNFDFGQVETGSQSGGLAAGKANFGPLQITKTTDAATSQVSLYSYPVNATNTVLETIVISFDGINTNTFTSTPCGPVPCTFESFSFYSIGQDPTVSFSVTSGSTNIAFSIVPESSTWVMMGLGFAGLAYAGYRARRGAVSNREAPDRVRIAVGS